MASKETILLSIFYSETGAFLMLRINVSKHSHGEQGDVQAVENRL